MRPIAALVLTALFTACSAGVILRGSDGTLYPERAYDEMVALYGSHDGTGGFRADVREKIDDRCEMMARWYEEGLLEKPIDHLWAAMTLTFSDRETHLQLALELGKLAAEGGEQRGNLAYAHTQDLLAMHRGAPTQPWGTVYRYNHTKSQYELFPPVDPRTSDAERKAMGVAPLRELRAGVEALNADPATEHLRTRIQESSE